MLSHNNRPNTIQKGDYKLDYKQYNTVKQIAYYTMLKHNNKIYNKQTTGKYYKYQEVLTYFIKQPKTKLLDYITYFEEEQYKLNNNKLKDHNQNTIKVKRLKQITQQQLEQLITTIQQLEDKYILDLDTDYTNKQSILVSYQQLLAYKYYKIPIQIRKEN